MNPYNHAVFKGWEWTLKRIIYIYYRLASTHTVVFLCL